MRTLLKYLFFLQIFMVSCVAHKETLYFNNLAETGKVPVDISEAPEVIIQPGDILNIEINSISKETNTYFNPVESGSDPEYGPNSYQVKSGGFIELPLISKVKAEGLTCEALEDSLKYYLKDYLQQPTVNVRIVNFKITVLGEVSQPGVYAVSNGKINVLQAVGMAGDITVYGRKNNVMLIRDIGNEKFHQRINLNDSAILTSDYFYLKNNDVIYVEPSKGKTNADDNFYRVFPMILSSLTFVAVLIGVVAR